MFKISVLVLHPSEAKQILVDYYANALINDRANTRAHIENGTLSLFVPCFQGMSDVEVATRFGELNLGEALAKSLGIGQVVIEVAENYTIVFDIGNLKPIDRWPVEINSVLVPPKPKPLDRISRLYQEQEDFWQAFVLW